MFLILIKFYENISSCQLRVLSVSCLVASSKLVKPFCRFLLYACYLFRQAAEIWLFGK